MPPYIPVDSGTGPNVAVDSVGSNNFQIIKIMQAADGTTAALGSTLAISGSVSVLGGPLAVTGTFTSNTVQYAAGTDLGATGTGVLVIGVQQGATTARGLLLHTTGGLIIASGGGGGVQYQALTTALGVTGTGNLILGLQATTAQALVANTSGQLLTAWPERLDATNDAVSCVQSGAWNIATITTLLGTVSVSGGGGGVQYPINSTALAATGTGTLVIGIESGATTARGLALTATGGIHTIQNIGTILGTVAVSGGGGGAQYTNATTGLGATGTGTLALGLQGTTAFGLTVTSNGQLIARVVNTVEVSVVNTPTVTVSTVLGTIAISGTSTMIPSGTQNVSVVNTPTVTASQGGTWNIATISTLLGTVAVSGGGGGVQYSIDTTAIGATGTGNLILGIQSGATTARGLALTTTGGIHTIQNVGTILATVAISGTSTVIPSGTQNVSVVNTPTVTASQGGVWNIATITTLLGTVAVSGGGGGVQYPIDTTAIGATGTGNLILGIQSGATTARGLAVTVTGGIHTVQNIGTVLSTIAISGTSTIIPSGTQNVTVVNTPTVTASQGGTWNIATVSTLLGTVAVSGGGGGAQYPIDSTAMANTATGNIMLGMQSGATTARGLALTVTGGIHTVQNIGTILGTVAVSGGGGGVQYQVDTTALGNTGTGTLILGVQSGATTARGLAVTATGGIHNIQTVANLTTGTVNVANTVAISGTATALQGGAWNIATVSTVLGVVAVSGGGGGVQYSQGDTALAATGTGNLIFGVISGGTTAQRLVVSTSGELNVAVVRSISTGTVNVVNVLSASGVTIASITTGTVNVVNVLSASGVTIASVATGTMNVVNVLSASGVTIANITTGTVSIAGTVTATGTFTQLALSTTIGHGRTTVAADATAVALTGDSIACKVVYITALGTNTGQIVVGGSGVTVLGSTLRGIPLQQLQSVELEIDNLNKIYINASNSSDGVSYAYLA